MTRPKILVFAFSMVGAEVLQELIKLQANIVAVYTYEDDPRETWFPSVKEMALANKIPVYTPEKIERKDVENITVLAPHIILSAYYRSLLPQNVLDVAPLGAFNMHGSLLPRYRGCAPVNWVLVNGETETGVTLHYMVAQADAGDIVDQETIPIEISDTAFVLTQKVGDVARKIIRRALPAIEKGSVRRKKQDNGQSTYFSRRTPEDGLICWSDNEQKIYNLIRAVTKPFPGAFTFLNGKKVFIWSAKITEDKSTSPPGTIVSASPLVVSTGGYDLEVLTFTTEAKSLTGQFHGA